MKKALIHSLAFIIIASIEAAVFSQPDKGKFLFGGNYNLDFSSNKRTFTSSVNNYEMEKNRSINFSPFAGYFILKTLSPGIKLDYEYSKIISPNGLGSSKFISTNSLLIVPSIRWYFLNSKIKPFWQAGYGFGLENRIETYYQAPKSKRNNILSMWELQGGLNFLINNYLSFEFGIGYSSLTVYYKDKMENGSYNKWQNVVNGTNTSLGIIFFL